LPSETAHTGLAATLSPTWRARSSRAAGRRALRRGVVGLRRWVAIAAFLAAWEVLPRLGVVDRTFLIPFSDVLVATWHLIRDGSLWTNVHTSMVRAVVGFAIALAVAIPLGLLIGWYALAEEILTPLFEVFRNTATLALLPVFTLLLGIGETSKIAIVVYACAFPIVMNTITGVREVDPLLIKSARSMGLGSARLFQKVILPAAVPTIFTGVRMAGSYAILVLVAAEMVGAKAGLGYLINYSQYNFQVPNMYAGILTISVIGVVVNTLLVRLERRFSSWRS
jgi:NitT/TauT family transport system permease protein